MQEPSGNNPNEVVAAKTDVWNELLESTLANRERSLSSAEWERLSEIARQYNGQSDAFEEFVIAIVESLLYNRFPTLVRATNDIRAMSRRIGQTLCSDPHSRSKLVEFQRQLCGNHCGT